MDVVRASINLGAAPANARGAPRAGRLYSCLRRGREGVRDTRELYAQSSVELGVCVCGC